MHGQLFCCLAGLLSVCVCFIPQDPGNEDERIAEAKRMLREADENGDGRISKQVGLGGCGVGLGARQAACCLTGWAALRQVSG